jgi:hypothetical protein
LGDGTAESKNTRESIGCPVSLGVADGQRQDNAFYAYPNPATQRLFIHCPDLQSVAGGTISDIAGKWISKTQITESGLDIEPLRPGVYFLTIVSGNESRHLKFIKQ